MDFLGPTSPEQYYIDLQKAWGMEELHCRLPAKWRRHKAEAAKSVVKLRHKYRPVLRNLNYLATAHSSSSSSETKVKITLVILLRKKCYPRHILDLSTWFGS